jgi:hypothetical protein
MFHVKRLFKPDTLHRFFLGCYSPIKVGNLRNRKGILYPLRTFALPNLTVCQYFNERFLFGSQPLIFGLLFVFDYTAKI